MVGHPAHTNTPPFIPKVPFWNEWRKNARKNGLTQIHGC